jgi:hypothetical protein
MGGPSSSWGTFDHSGAGERQRYRWSDGDLLGWGKRNGAADVSVAAERKSNVGYLYNASDNSFRQRGTVHGGGEQQRRQRYE